uniref:HECT domain-containing protein n=1 Tax=Macrostomum lignano TaxID=282301 RepID=A0A1I8FF37_9PLAT
QNVSRSPEPQQQQPPEQPGSQQGFSLAELTASFNRCRAQPGLASPPMPTATNQLLHFLRTSTRPSTSWCRTWTRSCASCAPYRRPGGASFSSIAGMLQFESAGGFAGKENGSPALCCGCTGRCCSPCAAAGPAASPASPTQRVAGQSPSLGGAQGGSRLALYLLPSRETLLANMAQQNACDAAGARPAADPWRAAASARRRGAGGGVSETPTSCICCPSGGRAALRLAPTPATAARRLFDCAQPSADSATASTAGAVESPSQRWCAADSLNFCAIRRHGTPSTCWRLCGGASGRCSGRQMKWRRQRLQQQRQAGLAACAPRRPRRSPISSEEAARLRDLLSACRRTPADPARVPLLLGATSAEDCRRLLLCSSAAATALLRAASTRVSDAALRSLASRARPVFLFASASPTSRARQRDYPRRPAQGAGRLRHHGGLAAAPAAGYDRLITGGRRRRQDRLAALLAQLAPANAFRRFRLLRSAVSKPREVKAEPEDSAAGQGL